MMHLVLCFQCTLYVYLLAAVEKGEQVEQGECGDQAQVHFAEDGALVEVCEAGEGDAG
jgi:hypothetical protein